MKTSIIQSLIDRNADKIACIEADIKWTKHFIKYLYENEYKEQVPNYKSELSKAHQTLKKLVAIQKELKKELADNIRNENSEAIHFYIYEGVN